MLCVAIEFLTGYYVATHPSARDRAEWPPHPARVFMAMAAAYFETGEDPGEKVALEFIEALPASPVIFASCAEHRSPVTHYVPVNDKLDPTGAAFPILRSRQPREFPRVRPENPVVYFSWPDAAVDGDMLAALASLCQKVTRIGHSSSLVRVWVCSDPPGDPDRYEWIADEAGIGEQLRLITPGSLAELRGLYRSADMAEFDRLENTIEGAKGVAKKTAKQEMATRFGGHRPQPVRPEFQITANYRIRTAHAVGAVRTIWDAGLFIASLEPPEHSRRRLDILSSPVLVRSLHKAMIKVAQQFGSVPEYISGHKPDGTPSESPHCVVFPLPFVGREHADGHILGVSVAMPVRATAADRHMVGKVLNGISKNGIQLGGLGKWGFALVGMPSPLLALRRET